MNTRAPALRLRALWIVAAIATSVAVVGCGGRGEVKSERPTEKGGKRRKRAASARKGPAGFSVQGTGNSFTVDDKDGKRILEAQVATVDGAVKPAQGLQGPVRLRQAKCRLFQKGQPQMDMVTAEAVWDGERLISEAPVHGVTSDQKTVIDAKRGTWTSKTGHLSLRTAKLQGMDAGKVDFTTTGPRAEVEGDVVLLPETGRGWNGSGQAVEADRIRWNRKSGELDCRGHVIVTEPGTRITGNRLEADTKLKRGRLYGATRVAMEKPPTRLAGPKQASTGTR